MLLTTKEKIDNHITGKNNLNAPFNQEEPPCCEDCLEDECNQKKHDSCKIRKQVIEDNNNAVRVHENKVWNRININDT